VRRGKPPPPPGGIHRRGEQKGTGWAGLAASPHCLGRAVRASGAGDALQAPGKRDGVKPGGIYVYVVQRGPTPGGPGSGLRPGRKRFLCQLPPWFYIMQPRRAARRYLRMCGASRAGSRGSGGPCACGMRGGCWDAKARCNPTTDNGQRGQRTTTHTTTDADARRAQQRDGDTK
jgi:hypothetical protein